MFRYFAEKKKKISLYLKKFLEERKNELRKVNDFGADVCTRLYDYSVRGKMLRGGLVFLGYDLFLGSALEGEIVKIAVALELLQSAFIIHDDIMDRDMLRRGIDSMHVQYEKLLKRDKFKTHRHAGESLGICSGDIAFFLSFSVLSTINMDAQLKDQILQIFAREVAFVGVAQMEDVFLGASEPSSPAMAALDSSVSEASILNLYRYKTGRYTFSLPLIVGATAAGCSRTVRSLLEKLGEDLGIIFQIKDDELGLFGSADESGKSVGSDIREGKKTLIYYLLATSLKKEQLNKFSAIYGNPSVSGEDINYIKDLAVNNAITEKINTIVDRYLDSVKKKLSKLKKLNASLSSEHLKILEELSVYCKERKK